MTTTPSDAYGSSEYGEGESTSALPDYSTGVETTYVTETTYTTDDESSGGTADTAKQEAQNVKDTTTQATQHVAGTAKEQVGQVAGDVKQSAQQLAEQARSQVSSQMSTQVTSQRDRAAESLRTLGQDFRTMAECSNHPGPAATVAERGADLMEQAADYLSQREPSELLDDVRNLARRRPAGFLVGAALAGVVVGRLSRGAMSARSSDGSSSSGYSQPGQHIAYGTTETTGYAPGYDVYGTPASTAAGTASGWSPTAAQPAPLLNEPYGEDQPPAGYDPGYGGRA